MKYNLYIQSFSIRFRLTNNEIPLLTILVHSSLYLIEIHDPFTYNQFKYFSLLLHLF